MKFIKIYKKFDKEYCDKVIEIFDDCVTLGSAHERNERNRTLDTQAELNSFLQGDTLNGKPNAQIDLRKEVISEMFFKGVNEAMHQYRSDLHMNEIGYSFRNMLVQKYDHTDCGGYHAFHCEADSLCSSDRYLVYCLYLNDIPEGEGETEFFYQGYRYQPKAGDLIIFPAGFTHTHRGNPSTTVDKYIATGWIFYGE